MITGNPFLRCVLIELMAYKSLSHLWIYPAEPLTPRHSSYNDTLEMRAVSHMCLVEDGPSIYTQALPTQACVRMRAQSFFPSCWDGVNLDSEDHKSHVSAIPRHIVHFPPFIAIFDSLHAYNMSLCKDVLPRIR